MPSYRSRALRFVLEHRHWLRGRLRRPVIEGLTSTLEHRALVERMAERMGRLPEGVEVVALPEGGPPAEWVRLRGAAKAPCVIWLHGGGYVLGSARSHRGIVAKVARASGLAALTVDYRLAPEHPFPAALEDTLATYRWLLAEGAPPSQIALGGDSAGGGLALATLLAARDEGLPLPAAAVALSPWTDLALTGATYERSDPVVPDGAFEIWGSFYAGERDKREPLISPLYGDLSGLPPLYLSAGDTEAMLDDTLNLAERAGAAGVPTTLRVAPGMVHCFPAMSPLFPEARAAMEEIGGFLREHTRDVHRGQPPRGSPTGCPALASPGRSPRARHHRRGGRP